jgi:hypothetical protein
MSFLKILGSVFSALQKGESADLSKDQIAALAQVGLSKNLYMNLPSAVPYADREEAISKGWIDSYVAYSISLGSREIFSLSEFYSANEFLNRWWKVTLNGVEEKKATWSMLRDPAAKISPKVTKVKENLVDAFQKPIVQVLLGEGSPNMILDFKNQVLDLGISSEEEIDDLLMWRDLGDRRDEVLGGWERRVNRAKDRLTGEYLAPCAFMVGSTGLPPKNDLSAYDAEGLKQVCPQLSETKIPDGTYFLLGEHVVGIFPETCWFSTRLGMEAAKILKNSSIQE